LSSTGPEHRDGTPTWGSPTAGSRPSATWTATARVIDADGIHDVLVAGQQIAVDGEYTGVRPGRVLRSWNDTDTPTVEPRIRVNAVAPGSTWTLALERYYTPAELEAKIARTPMRRLSTPEDIALAVLFFASPASGYVSGEVLEVDGGIDWPNSPSVLPDLLSI
jgi:Enoyl-(Acyl carrier protein) reductase